MNMIVNYIVTVPFDGFNVHDFNASLSGNKKNNQKTLFTSTTVLQTDEKNILSVLSVMKRVHIIAAS